MQQDKLVFLHAAVADLKSTDMYAFIRLGFEANTEVVIDASLPAMMQAVIAMAHTFASNAPKTATIDQINGALFDAVKAGAALAFEEAKGKTDHGAH